MNRVAFLLILLVTSLPTAASHTWAEIDICEVYIDKLPPGLTLASLPESQSQGAALLSQYCTQCHNLPGPDRHTAIEWNEVASKMFMLMDISNRFGGLMGRVETMQPQDQVILRAYLERHAVQAGERGRSQTAQQNRNDFVSSRSLTPTPGERPWLTRTLALLPFLLLMGLGLLRWWRNSHNGHKSCVID